MPNHKTTFINSTPLPVSLESWQNKFYFCEEFINITVQPDETIQMISSTGEWIVTTDLYDKEHLSLWTKAGYNPGFRIGKFRNQAAHDKKYTWLSHDDFEIIYVPENNEAKLIKK